MIFTDIEQVTPADLEASNLKLLAEGLLPGIRTLAFNIVISIILYFVGKKLIKVASRIAERALARTQADEGLTQFIKTALDYILHVFLIIAILAQLGVNTASLVTVLVTVLVAIGMSLQGSLSNVAGGILILIMRPFRVGHYIICDYGEGTVRSIGLVYTTITMKDNRVLTIPNGQLSACAVTDCTENPERRLDLTVGISYDADIRLAKKILEDILKNNPYVLQDMDTDVFVEKLADSSVDMGLCCYVASDDFLAAKRDILEKIKLSFDGNGIQIPFPQVQIHMEK